MKAGLIEGETFDGLRARCFQGQVEAEGEVGAECAHAGKRERLRVRGLAATERRRLGGRNAISGPLDSIALHAKHVFHSASFSSAEARLCDSHLR